MLNNNTACYGKTYLANEFGLTADRSFMTVEYFKLPEPLGEFAIARAEGNYRKLMKSYKTVQLLILDEWLLSPHRDTESKELLEIVEARYKKGSTIFCSQFDVGGWICLTLFANQRLIPCCFRMENPRQLNVGEW